MVHHKIIQNLFPLHIFLLYLKNYHHQEQFLFDEFETDSHVTHQDHTAAASSINFALLATYCLLWLSFYDIWYEAMMLRREFDDYGKSQTFNITILYQDKLHLHSFNCKLMKPSMTSFILQHGKQNELWFMWICMRKKCSRLMNSNSLHGVPALNNGNVFKMFLISRSRAINILNEKFISFHLMSKFCVWNDVRTIKSRCQILSRTEAHKRQWKVFKFQIWTLNFFFSSNMLNFENFLFIYWLFLILNVVR